MLLAAVLGTGGWALWGRDSNAGTSASPKGEPSVPLPHSGLRGETVEKTPHDPRASRLFTLEAPESASTPGSWATATSYVKPGPASVNAYSLPGGKRRWRIPLSGDVCGATQDVTPEGLTAVAFRDRVAERRSGTSQCDRLLVFDIDDGREAWRTRLPKSKTRWSAPTVTIGNGVVAASWYQGSVAYPITGGKALWSEGAAQCSYEVTLSGGRDLIAKGSGCVQKRSERVIWKVDPRTGRPVWTYKVPRKYWTSAVLSTDPVTVAVGEGDTDVDHEDTEMTHVLSLDEHGRLRATIPLDRGFDLYNWDYREREHVVTRDTLYLPTLPEENGNYFGAIVAFDLKTGKVRKTFASEAGRHMVPLRMSGDRLLALQADDGSGPETVVKVFGIDPATGDKTVMLRAESSDEDVRILMGLDAPNNVPAVFEHGRLFFGRDAYTVPDPGDRYLGVVFGVD